MSNTLFAKLNAYVKVCAQMGSAIRCAEIREDDNIADVRSLWDAFVAQSVVPSLLSVVNIWLTVRRIKH